MLLFPKQWIRLNMFFFDISALLLKWIYNKLVLVSYFGLTIQIKERFFNLVASDGLYYMFIDMFALQPKADRPGLFRTSNEYAVII